MSLTQMINETTAELNKISDHMRTLEYALEYQPSDFYRWRYSRGDHVPIDKHSKNSWSVIQNDQNQWFKYNQQIEELYMKIMWLRVFKKMLAK